MPSDILLAAPRMLTFSRCKSLGSSQPEKDSVDSSSVKCTFLKLKETADDEDLTSHISNFRTRSAPLSVHDGISLFSLENAKPEKEDAAVKGRSAYNFHVGLLHVYDQMRSNKSKDNLALSHGNQIVDSEMADFLSLFGAGKIPS